MALTAEERGFFKGERGNVTYGRRELGFDVTFSRRYHAVMFVMIKKE